MKIFDKVTECFAELGEGCNAAWDNTIEIAFIMKAASLGKQALFGGLLIISSLIMTILFGVAMVAAPIIGPILLWVSFAFYSHASPFICVRLGFVLWYIVIQLAIGVSCIAIGSLLF